MKKLLAILFVCCMVLSLAACNEKDNPWTESYDQGTACLSDGKFEEAIPFLEEALALAPEEPGIYSALAAAYAGTGDTESAADVLTKGLAETDDEGLAVQYEELTGSSEAGGSAAVSPAEAPALPENMVNEIVYDMGYPTDPEFSADTYFQMDGEFPDLDAMIEKGQAGDRDGVWTIAHDKAFWEQILPAGIEKAGGLQEAGPLRFWALRNGAILRFELGLQMMGKATSDYICLDYCPENGPAFRGTYQLDECANQEMGFGTGASADFQLQGDVAYDDCVFRTAGASYDLMSHTLTESSSEVEFSYRCSGEGTAENDLLVGEYTLHYYDGTPDYVMTVGNEYQFAKPYSLGYGADPLAVNKSIYG